MSRYRRWVLTLGIIVATPSITNAGPRLFPFFRSKAVRSARETGGRQQTVNNKNQQTADRIARALRAANLSGFDIAIEYRGGTAILVGTVNDSQLKAKANRIVGRVPGVVRVDNRLQVSSSDTDPSFPPVADFQAVKPSAESPVKPVGFQSPAPATIPSNSGRPIEKIAANPFDGPAPSRSNQEIAQDVAHAVA